MARRRCNAARPCQSCASRHLECTYASANVHAGREIEVVGTAKDRDTGKQSTPPLFSFGFPLPVFDLDSDPAQFFPFLLEFTKDLSLPHSFENRKAVLSKATIVSQSFLGNQLETGVDYNLFFDLDGLSWTMYDLPPLTCPDVLTVGQSSALLPTSISTPGDAASHNPGLASKAAEIVQALQLGTSLPQSRFGSDFIEDAFVKSSQLNFFTPERLSRYLDLYWEMWYPNWPTIHRPLFDPTHASGLLVAAMAVIGACHSSDLEERTAANFWADALENWASRELDMIDSVSPQSRRRHDLQTVQAACIICIYQNWNGTVESKRRMRRKFFSAIVGACRDMDMSRARHRDYRFVSQAEFDWKGFVEAEEMIRTFIWVFNIDTAFVIFNGSPPRIVLSELKMSLACPEKCFQAVSAEQCFMGVQWWMYKTKRAREETLFDFVKTFCSRDIEPTARDAYAHEGFVNLFAIPSALHVLVYNMGSTMDLIPDQQAILHVERALKNWKAIWNRRLSIDRTDQHSIAICDVSIEPEGELEATEYHSHSPALSEDSPTDTPDCRQSHDWQRAGFWRHASEYWLLVRLFLERLQLARHNTQSETAGIGRQKTGSQGDTMILKRRDEADMAALHNFLSSWMRSR